MSFSPIAASVAALLLPCMVEGADPTAYLAQQFSVAGTVPPVQSAPFTLLDPVWLAPPGAAGALLTDPPAAAQRRDLTEAAAPLPAQSTATAAPRDAIGYSLSDDLDAEVHYARSEPIDRANSETLRRDDLSAFSTRPDRDVLGLNMSWRLSGNTVGIAYELQSTRPGAGTANVASLPFLQGSEGTVHAFTFGLTRRWGASVPPAPVEPVGDPEPMGPASQP